MAFSSDLDPSFQTTLATGYPTLMPVHGPYMILSTHFPGEQGAGSPHIYPAGDGVGFSVPMYQGTQGYPQVNVVHPGYGDASQFGNSLAYPQAPPQTCLPLQPQAEGHRKPTADLYQSSHTPQGLPVDCSHEAPAKPPMPATGVDPPPPPSSGQERERKRSKTKCTLCGKSVYLMKRHRSDKHGAVSTFKCPVTGCRRGGRSFKRKDNLTQHQRFVHGLDIPKRQRKKPEGSVEL